MKNTISLLPIVSSLPLQLLEVLSSSVAMPVQCSAFSDAITDNMFSSSLFSHFDLSDGWCHSSFTYSISQVESPSNKERVECSI